MSEKVTVKLNPQRKAVKIVGAGIDFGVEQQPHEDVIRKEKEAAYEKGFNDGQVLLQKELEENFTQKLLEKFKQLHEMFSDFDEHILEYERSFEMIVVALSLEIAEKVVKRELKNKSTIEENLRESLKKVLGANDVFVRMNPEDFQEMNHERSDFLKDSSYSKIRFEADDSIGKGGCFVETEIGNVDSRISTQITEIKKQLEASFEEEL